MNFPSEEKKNNPKQEKPCPQQRDRSIITNAEIPKAFSFL